MEVDVRACRSSTTFPVFNDVSTGGLVLPEYEVAERVSAPVTAWHCCNQEQINEGMLNVGWSGEETPTPAPARSTIPTKTIHR